MEAIAPINNTEEGGATLPITCRSNPERALMKTYSQL